jgi:hypothetical protein
VTVGEGLKDGERESNIPIHRYFEAFIRVPLFLRLAHHDFIIISSVVNIARSSTSQRTTIGYHQFVHTTFRAVTKMSQEVTG